MGPLPKPEVIFTHESDLDGFLSGLLLQRLADKLFGTKIPLEAYHNHSWRQRDMKEKSAWVADMTFDPRLDREDWVVIDHHAYDHPPKKARLIHDVNKSASLLCYELCKEHGMGSPELDRLVHLSNVADLYLDQDPDFDAATDYAGLIKIYQFWNIYDLIEGRVERLLNHPLLQVLEVKRKVENPIGFEWSSVRVQQISPTIGFVQTIIGNSSMIVHRMLDEQVSPYPVLLYAMRRGNTMMVSIRSKNGEAIKVAEKLQGGGHANAAGATLPRSALGVNEAINYLRQVLNPAPSKNAALQSLENAFSALDNLKLG